ncbi:MAG TPA: helix-turn-helix domain-containing protein [Patescibacteria group bacterium]
MNQEANKKANLYTTPVLFPYDPGEFWQMIRQIIKEELALGNNSSNLAAYETPGLTYKPLYKMSEVCDMFNVSKPTVYDWCKHGKLKPVKIRSRVYFLWQDIQQLLQTYGQMPHQ